MKSAFLFATICPTCFILELITLLLYEKCRLLCPHAVLSSFVLLRHIHASIFYTNFGHPQSMFLLLRERRSFIISVSYEVMNLMQFQSLLVLLPSFWQGEEAEYISDCILAAQYVD